jgi:hypothetical protein
MSENSRTVPSNADRTALAKILDVIQTYEDDAEAGNCEAVVREIQHVAVFALNDAPPPGDYWRGWSPDAKHINGLPQPVRQYIHDLETRADPAGDVAELACLRETVAALEIRVEELEAERKG